MDTVKRELYFLVITWPKTMITQCNYAKMLSENEDNKNLEFEQYTCVCCKKSYTCILLFVFSFHLYNAIYLCLSICLFTVQFKVINVIFILQYFKIIPTVVHFVVQLILPVIFIVDLSLCVFCLDSTDDHDADL